jgi:phage terminase large subunit GpA-like protein
VRTVVFIKSSGVGGTEAMYNWLGYTMHHLQNKDMLCVLPTLELRDRSFNPRLSKMLDETEALSELVSTASRNKANRGDLLEYGARARIIKAGANSPDSLRSDHLPYVICDEVDAFPWDVGGEGDPMTLIENRQRTYSRAKTYLVSTPTTEHASRIAQMYARSDRRRYFVPCPHCGEFQTLEWGGRDTPYGLKWRIAPDSGDDAKVVADSWYVCRHCAAIIEEGSKTEMLSGGRWIAERPNIKLVRGYHINALYAPIGLGLGWKKVAQKWLDAQNDSSELKAFVNTYLGEVYREEGDSIESLSLLSRLEDYAAPAILFISAGVDVQKDRLEASIVGWGLGEEGWLLDHLIIPGDTARPEVWQELGDQLADAGVEFAAVDSGYNTSMAYAFVEKRRWCAAVKGVTGMGRPLIEDEKKRRQRLRVKRKKGIPVEPLGVDQGKALAYSRLKLTAPGPGYIHFPRDAAFDDEYFAQLAAEKLVTKIKETRPIQQWVQTRPRNEALDCLVYALAALRLSRIDLAVRAGRIAARGTPQSAPPPSSMKKPEPQTIQRRQRRAVVRK